MTKVLIVDDNENMRRIIRMIISDMADVFECRNGAEAIAACAVHNPDWVLMDIKMSGLNGIAATKVIKSEWPEARIVIVTDYDDMILREAARRAGASDYVIKEDLRVLREILATGTAVAKRTL